MKKAVFMDRDGVIIEQVAYLSSPEQVALIPGAAAARAAVAPYWFAPIAITVWWWFLPPSREEAAMAAARGGAPTTVADPLFSGAFAFFGSHSAFDREIFR